MSLLPTLAMERKLWADGCKNVIGIDETGYGSALGPLYVAAVGFPVDMAFEDLPVGLNDSKKLTPRKREDLYSRILEKAAVCMVVSADPEAIDEHNVLRANMQCMDRIYDSLKPDFVLVDGINRPKTWDDAMSSCVVRGDSKSVSIAAASIVAKVERDRYMHELCDKYPDLDVRYGARSNKGYLSKVHMEGLDEWGRTKFHRQSYKYKWQQQRKICE